MRIDLRYPIAVAAFFAPTPVLKFMFWLWGVEVTEATVAAIFSLIFGAFALAAAVMILFDFNSDPIWWPKGSDE